MKFFIIKKLKKRVIINIIKLGRPSDEFLEQPITINDNPYLRQYATSDLVQNAKSGKLEPSKEALSAERRVGETELDYYERRYKERVLTL